MHDNKLSTYADFQKFFTSLPDPDTIPELEFNSLTPNEREKVLNTAINQYRDLEKRLLDCNHKRLPRVLQDHPQIVSYMQILDTIRTTLQPQTSN
jgi:hypothetical protein